jgi:hypothetical protein
MRRWKYDQPMNVEAAMYLALAEIAKDEGLLPRKETVFQYHVVSAKEQKVRVIEMGSLDGNAMNILQQALSEATTIEKYGAYRPKPDWNLCSKKYCAYFDGCRIDGSLSPYSLTVSHVSSMQATPLASTEGAE